MLVKKRYQVIKSSSNWNQTLSLLLPEHKPGKLAVMGVQHESVLEVPARAGVLTTACLSGIAQII